MKAVDVLSGEAAQLPGEIVKNPTVQRQINSLKNGSIKALELKLWTVTGGGRAPCWYHCG